MIILFEGRTAHFFELGGNDLIRESHASVRDKGANGQASRAVILFPFCSTYVSGSMTDYALSENHQIWLKDDGGCVTASIGITSSKVFELFPVLDMTYI